LIPYFQYTVGAVLGTLLLGWGCWQRSQGGFWGASVQVDPDSLVTPWLVAFWLAAVLRGLRRGHAVLGRFYDLTGIATPRRAVPWEEVAGYFRALSVETKMHGQSLGMPLARRYSQATRQFLFGIPSQHRAPNRP
jgi:hypothetical protein